MGRLPARSLVATALVATLVLGGCGDGSDDGSDGAGTASGSASADGGTDGTSTDGDGTDNGTDSGTGGTGGDQDSGTGRPTAPTPTRTLLPWQPTGGSAEDRRIVGPAWTAVVDDRGSEASFTGPGDKVTLEARGRRIVSEVLMDDRWAVTVFQDEQEQQPSEVTVVDLADPGGTRRSVTDPVPASGGSWSMHGGTVHYGTFDGRAYCLAEVEVASGSGEAAWCAGERQGFTRLTDGQHGTGLITFDDARPVACRTPNLLVDGEPQPVDEAEDCSAWDVAATDGGAAWSEVQNERRAEVGTFRAVADGTTYDLGPGTTGTLTPCGDSVYFVRDPQSREEPARLLRWTPDERLEMVFESTSTGNVFLAPPECAGDVLTVSAYGAQGDEQVTAPAP